MVLHVIKCKYSRTSSFVHIYQELWKTGTDSQLRSYVTYDRHGADSLEPHPYSKNFC